MSLLSIRNLSVLFKNNNEISQIVNEISFDIKVGKTLALVGASGSGKTVTALSILKLFNPSTVIYSGEVYYDNMNLLTANNEQINAIRGRDISMIFQEPMTALNPLHTIDKQIIENIVTHTKLTLNQAKHRADELLSLVGLEFLRERRKVYPHELSGGQRQRVMIAMSLANNPKLLIADEPTTALDVTTQAEILSLLKKLQKKFNLAILLITHDLRIVQKFADDVCVMNRGKIVEKGRVIDIWSNPQNEYTQSLINAEPHHINTEPKNNHKFILDVAQLSVKFKLRTSFWKTKNIYFKALDHINLKLKQGETLGIVGESGSGKSTLAQAILKLIPFEGNVIYEDTLIHQLTAKQFKKYRQHLQLVFQDPYGSLNPRLMVQQILQEGLDIHFKHLDNSEKQVLIDEVINDVQLQKSDIYKYPHQFSGGQRQRIALARVLILRPKIIILDEPTSALDRLIQKDILKLLSDMQNKYQLSYILISHDLTVIRSLAHHVIVLKDGKIIENGVVDQIFNQPQENYTKKLLSAAFNLEK